MAEYGPLRFDNLSPGGDHHRIIPSHWIATTGLGPSLHGVEMYHPESVAFFAVHGLDFIKLDEVAESLHRRLDANALAAFLADERLDDSEAAKHVGPSAMRTPGAAHFRRREFHQP
jgi:hypothetical protein